MTSYYVSMLCLACPRNQHKSLYYGNGNSLIMLTCNNHNVNISVYYLGGGGGRGGRDRKIEE